MNLKNVISNLKKAIHWGPRGVITYLKNQSHIRRLRARLLASQQGGKPARGITLIGEFTAFGSHAKVMRDLAMKLYDAEIPFQTFDTTKSPSLILEEEMKAFLTPRDEFHIDRFARIVEILPNIVPPSIGIPRARIAFWEFESGFLYGYPDMPNEDHVIAMSDFNAAYFRRILPAATKVSKILYPFQPPTADVPSKADARRTFGIPSETFTVLFNFDFGGGFNRKNPDGALYAFARAFADHEDAVLVLKTKQADAHPDRIRALKSLAETLGIAKRLLFVNQNVSQRDIYGLVNACDVYLSLHRGEGFGITLAEAMAMGKPVVCTDWSSTTEFCQSDCTLPVSSRMVAVKPEQIDNPFYRQVKEWAEPDIDAAANALRRLKEDEVLRTELGRKAARSIRKQFSTENFRVSVESFLGEQIGST